MARLDPSVWNLGLPLLAAACGPIVASDGTETDAGSEVGEGESEVGPGTTTMPATSTGPVQCRVDEDCPDGYGCIEGQCYYTGCGDDDGCCEDDCGYSECYSNADCGFGSGCRAGLCQPIEAEIDCGPPMFADVLPIPIDAAGLYSFAFIESDLPGDVDNLDLLIGTDAGVFRIAAIDQPLERLGDQSFVAGALAVGDLDADGDADVVVGDRMPQLPVRVLTNDVMWSVASIDGLPSLRGVALADVAGDGFPDIYVWGLDAPVALAPNTGGVVDPLLEVFEPAMSLAVGRLDGDDFDDVVLHTYSTWAVYQGSSFADIELPDGSQFATSRLLAVDDFDGDGQADVLALESLPNGGTIVTSWAAPVLRSTWHDTWWGNPVAMLQAADIDGDGVKDLVGASTDGVITVAYGGGDVLRCVSYFSSALTVAAITALDITADGRVDLVVTDGEQLLVLPQNG